MVDVFSYGGRPAVSVRVTPGAKQSCVQGELAGRLKVRVAAPAEAGRANAAVVAVVARALGLPATHVGIVAGHGSRDKVIAFTGIDEVSLRSRLAGCVGDTSGDGEVKT